MAKKKKKKKKRAERSAENKRKWAEMRAAEAKAKKSAKKKKVKKKAAVKKPLAPAIEQSQVKTTPWPRAGDNAEFEDILKEDMPAIDGPSPKPKADAAEPKEQEDAELKTSDVAEWVIWPFALWSTSQNLPMIIKPKEAIEIAEPLTRILNRHGISQRIPPDVIDGLQVLGRTVPVVKRGSELVKTERQRREVQGGPVAPPGPTPQGARRTEPIER